MNTLSAVLMAYSHIDDPKKVFDWNKAARLIGESGALEASAGLSQDWEYSGDTIYEDGKPVLDCHPYLSSVWATPEIEIDGFLQDCYIMENDVPADWGEDYPTIVWPQSALVILSQYQKG